VDDFIGSTANKHGSGARVVALHIERAVMLAKAAGNSPLKYLLNGRPGLGKTALTKFATGLLGCNKWSTNELNGTQVKLEVVEDLARSMHYSSLFGDYRLVIINEADEIPRVAQVRLLSVLDDLPDGAAVLCTSNCKIKDFEERFQTRFQAFDLIGPESAEIEKLLLRYLPDPRVVSQIANMAGGNVRQALLDTLGAYQASTLQMPLAA
jgi:replication-associated recombination protein RarA